jgi:PBSX family phage terminase large subunit
MTKTCYKGKIDKNPKQLEALRLISKNKITLLEGGGRSSKTFTHLYVIIVRALLIKSDHLVCRFRFAHAKQSICHQTMPKLLDLLCIKNRVHLNKSEWFYEFPNGSRIWIGGLDDKERTEKILGNEYATIFFNEASQISYESFEILLTRLNPPEGLKGKILLDYNPPSKKHWGYKIFHERKYPDGRPVPDNDYAYLKMNPIDNKFVSKEYMETLETLSVRKRKRFRDGEYSDDLGTLWHRTWFKYDNKIESFSRIAIGVDPTGTKTGDEVGIVVAGIKNDIFYILDDYSLHGTPKEWADEVNASYEKWKADIVVAEKNYGGDMVESTLKNSNSMMNVKLVVSSRGKILRAEPISALYEQGKVVHRTLFNDLEDEMCMYEETSDFSPNRLDAAVFALTELSGIGGASMWD